MKEKCVYCGAGTVWVSESDEPVCTDCHDEGVYPGQIHTDADDDCDE
jgi:hypothetical protein